MVIYCPQITASPSPAISLDKIVLPFFFSWSELKRPYSEMGICTCIPLFLERAQRIFRLVLEFQTTFLYAFSFCTQDHILEDDRHKHDAGRGKYHPPPPLKWALTPLTPYRHEEISVLVACPDPWRSCPAVPAMGGTVAVPSFPS